MGFLDRILLVLYSLAVAGVALLTVSHVFRFPLLDRLYVEYPYQVLVAAVILFLLSLRFIFIRSGDSGELQAIVSKTEHGEVRISVQTLESLAERAARLVRGVNDLKTKVRPSEVGIRVAVRISVDPDLNIPQLTSTVQEKITDYVESTTGLTVQEVIVHVSDIAKPQAGKVPARPRVE